MKWGNAFIALIVGLLASLAHAEAPKPAPGFEAWLVAFRQEARAAGISEEVLNRAFAGVTVSEKVLKLDSQQTTKSVSLDDYIKARVNAHRINKGREKLAQHRDLLRRIERRYAVQPRFVVAFWGIETNFGGYMGRHDVIQSLTTLAYDPRRGSYFRGELLAALQILQEGHITREELKGSWAGAMGHGQFMPTSYRRFAQDFDQDGRADIWRSEPDALASIANYLREQGWSDDHTWGRRVLVPESLRTNFETLLPEARPQGCRALGVHSAARPLSAWEALGVRAEGNQALPRRDDLQATLVIPDPRGPAYLTYDNFKGILKYNCSNFYALSVAKLSDHYQ